MLGRKAKAAAAGTATGLSTRTYRAKIKIYRDGAGEFRWRLVASNGRIIADSAEGYTDKAHCEQAVVRFVEAAQTAAIVESAEEIIS